MVLALAAGAFLFLEEDDLAPERAAVPVISSSAGTGRDQPARGSRKARFAAGSPGRKGHQANRRHHGIRLSAGVVADGPAPPRRLACGLTHVARQRPRRLAPPRSSACVPSDTGCPIGGRPLRSRGGGPPRRRTAARHVCRRGRPRHPDPARRVLRHGQAARRRLRPVLRLLHPRPVRPPAGSPARAGPAATGSPSTARRRRPGARTSRTAACTRARPTCATC